MALNAPVLLWLMRGWDGFLERDRDRAVFDLAPKPQFHPLENDTDRTQQSGR